ncbi:unnamed protein product [Urochloa humidicola]
MEAIEDLAGVEHGKDDDTASRLTYQIFSLLKAKFHYGLDVVRPALTIWPPRAFTPRKVFVCSIDGDARTHPKGFSPVPSC